MKILTAFFSILGLLCLGQASIQIKPIHPQKNTIEKIVKSLEVPGVILKNITSNQKVTSNQLADFYDPKKTLGMKKGILLSTGSVKIINGGNKFEGLTGQTYEVPSTEYDTISQTIPCYLKGKIDINTSVKTTTLQKIPIQEMFEMEELPDDELNMENTNKDFVLLNNSPQVDFTNSNFNSPKLGIYSDSLTGNTEMCTQTYIIQKSQPFTSNLTNDPDLKNEIGNQYNFFDACIIEMDIVPLGDTLRFNYLFGSEEYDEYVCSPFNDAFAFYLSGPNIKGKENLAKLESGSRITINSINKGNGRIGKCKAKNPSFYNRNMGQIPLEYDGFTRTLAINQKVIPNKTYHLKIIIADASDGIYDSGVFIENNSMISFNDLATIHFANNSSISTELNQLDTIIEKAKTNLNYKLEVSGHTDSRGSDEENLKLSLARIEQVTNYLINRGVSENKTTKINKGEHLPIASNKTEFGRQKNRRVEVRLIPTK